MLLSLFHHPVSLSLLLDDWHGSRPVPSCLATKTSAYPCSFCMTMSWQSALFGPAKVEYTIQWRWSTTYREDHFVVMFGRLHTVRGVTSLEYWTHRKVLHVPTWWEGYSVPWLRAFLSSLLWTTPTNYSRWIPVHFHGMVSLMCMQSSWGEVYSEEVYILLLPLTRPKQDNVSVKGAMGWHMISGPEMANLVADVLHIAPLGIYLRSTPH